MLEGIWPLILQQLAAGLAADAAKKEPSPQLAAAAYRRTQRYVAFAALAAGLAYTIYTAYADGDPMERGSGIYGILGVLPSTPKKKVGQAYRKLSLVYHPDKNPTAAEHYDLINSAYQLIKDPQLRYVYDTFGTPGLDLVKKAGQNGYFAACQRQILAGIAFWASSLAVVLLGALAGNANFLIQLGSLALGLTLELYCTTRRWESWPLPIPLFQCIKILHYFLPVLLSSLALIYPAPPKPIRREVEEISASLARATVLASRHLETISAPFQSDEQTMKRLCAVANGAANGANHN